MFTHAEASFTPIVINNALRCNQTETDMGDEGKKVTFRSNNGKAHRGVIFSGGFLFACCSCPGSQNGKLAKFAKIICEGHEKANCGN